MHAFHFHPGFAEPVALLRMSFAWQALCAVGKWALPAAFHKNACKYADGAVRGFFFRDF